MWTEFMCHETGPSGCTNIVKKLEFVQKAANYIAKNLI
jgi:hypothetical protein